VAGASRAEIWKHPEIFIPERKELHFFDDESINWPDCQYGEYEANFVATQDSQIVGKAQSRSEKCRGALQDMLSIHVRPPEVEDRFVPGHWEGDLIKGAGNRSSVGTLLCQDPVRDDR
jgi:hypothetical protein